MIEQMQRHQLELEKLMEENPPGIDWQKQMETFNLQLTHLQNERLMHLVVTMTVGIAALITCLFSITSQQVFMIAVDAILAILFIAYIFHYRRLENTTQKMYPTLERVKDKTKTPTG